MSQTLYLSAGTLPDGICNQITSEQTRLNVYASNLSVVVPSGGAAVYLSTTKPADTTAVWGKLDALGRIVRYYMYYNGSWIAAHPLVPGFTMIYTGALPDFTTFDGGSPGAVGLYSGPMWEVNTTIHGTDTEATMTARFPIAVGKLQTSGTAIAVTNTGGEEHHVLTAAEGGPHRHAIGAMSANHQQIAVETGGTFTHQAGYAPGGSGDVTPAAVADVGAFGQGFLQTDYGDNTIASGVQGDVEGHDTIPPYVGVWFLRRTARQFYVE